MLFMTQILQQLQKEVASLRRDVQQLQRALTARTAHKQDDEDKLELADDVVAEIQASRRRKREEFISHDAIMKKYYVR